jgi:hypothetical protein
MVYRQTVRFFKNSHVHPPIKGGFGRRNPISTKFGRERRGKKKKNTQEKAYVSRRYKD